MFETSVDGDGEHRQDGEVASNQMGVPIRALEGAQIYGRDGEATAFGACAEWPNMPGLQRLHVLFQDFNVNVEDPEIDLKTYTQAPTYRKYYVYMYTYCMY